MLTTNENNILFDDAEIIETALGASYLRFDANHLSPDCNCSSDVDIEENDMLFDDVTMIENARGKGYLNATTVNANCDCGT
ncbi:hypothetical protein [Hufsiella ginkgonis]|uniref:Uncharacterized protein n=1 Tax=Hufsiella ginkgonis TaxID=2695274 RepID=A0A7K1Y0W2_9SPHI|nr:hypothetical protein [Hufsiella ginkgonis]MXV16883.1 hypothetical protein [Hufsiella ginkgonis]